MSTMITEDVNITVVVTKYLKTLAKRRLKPNRGITADVAQHDLDKIGYEGQRSFIGGILRKPNWRPRGFTHSKIKANHGRTIRIWMPTARLLNK